MYLLSIECSIITVLTKFDLLVLIFAQPVNPAQYIQNKSIIIKTMIISPVFIRLESKELALTIKSGRLFQSLITQFGNCDLFWLLS